MKKQSVFLAMLAMVLVFGLAFAGCENEPTNKVENGEGGLLVNQQSIDDGGTFNAKILEINASYINGTYVLVEPLEGEAILSISDRISFLSDDLNYIDVSAGDYITIRYDGFVEKSYPARIVATGWVLLQTNHGSGGETVTFNATIIEIHGTYVLVEPLANEFFPRSGERVTFETGNLTAIDISVGDVVTVWYDGSVMETNPPRVNPIAWALSQATAEPKSIRITDISDATTIVRVGVYLFTELPTILSLPLPVAVGYGDNPGGGSASLIDLTVPLDGGGIFDGPPWTGNGAYYVAAAIDRGPMVYFAGGGEAPVKVAFNQALTSLEFYRFKAWSPQ